MIEAALDSHLAGKAAKLVVLSRFADEAVTAALSGPLIDVAADDLFGYAVLQRVSKKALASDTADVIVERALDSPELWLLADRIAGSQPVEPRFEWVTGRMLRRKASIPPSGHNGATPAIETQPRT